MVLRMKNVNVTGVHWKIRFLEGFHEKPIYRGELPQKGGRGAWTVCRFKRGLDKKEGGGVFEGDDTPMHTVCIATVHQQRFSWICLTK